jgi:hypothetical protein
MPVQACPRGILNFGKMIPLDYTAVGGLFAVVVNHSSTPKEELNMQ